MVEILGKNCGYHFWYTSSPAGLRKHNFRQIFLNLCCTQYMTPDYVAQHLWKVARVFEQVSYVLTRNESQFLGLGFQFRKMCCSGSIQNVSEAKHIITDFKISALWCKLEFSKILIHDTRLVIVASINTNQLL